MISRCTIRLEGIKGAKGVKVGPHGCNQIIREGAIRNELGIKNEPGIRVKGDKAILIDIESVICIPKECEIKPDRKWSADIVFSNCHIDRCTKINRCPRTLNNVVVCLPNHGMGEETD